jgi:hypothetical protein
VVDLCTVSVIGDGSRVRPADIAPIGGEISHPPDSWSSLRGVSEVPQEGCGGFAVGILAVWPEMSEMRRREERVRLALHAHRHGYFLVDTLEVTGNFGDKDTYQFAEDLAIRTDAEAFVVLGEVDLAQLERIAGAVRMTMRVVPDPGDGWS